MCELQQLQKETNYKTVNLINQKFFTINFYRLHFNFFQKAIFNFFKTFGQNLCKIYLHICWFLKFFEDIELIIKAERS